MKEERSGGLLVLLVFGVLVILARYCWADPYVPEDDPARIQVTKEMYDLLGMDYKPNPSNPHIKIKELKERMDSVEGRLDKLEGKSPSDDAFKLVAQQDLINVKFQLERDVPLWKIQPFSLFIYENILYQKVSSKYPIKCRSIGNFTSGPLRWRFLNWDSEFKADTKVTSVKFIPVWGNEEDETVYKTGD